MTGEPRWRQPRATLLSWQLPPAPPQASSRRCRPLPRQAVEAPVSAAAAGATAMVALRFVGDTAMASAASSGQQLARRRERLETMPELSRVVATAAGHTGAQPQHWRHQRRRRALVAGTDRGGDGRLPAPDANGRRATHHGRRVAAEGGGYEMDRR